MRLEGTIGLVGDPNSPINLIANSFQGFSQARRPLGPNGNTATADSLQAVLNGIINLADPLGPHTSFDISVNGSDPVHVNIGALSDVQIDALGNVAGVALHFQERINTALATVTTDTVTCSFVSEPA